MSAVDILCVRHPDGVIKGSPFYVRFNSYAKSRTKVVVCVNDREISYDKLVVEKDDYHARFDQPVSNWKGDFWPVYTSWEEELGVDLENEESIHQIFTARLMSRIVPDPQFLLTLGLNDGVNTISFMMEQTKETAKCRIFLWDWSTRIVVSDIDGTVTDGREILSRFSDTYTKYAYCRRARSGIAKLYCAIKSNDYHIFYLTGRPILQAELMRGFIEGIVQDNHNLPHGPLFTTPYRTYISRAYKVWRGEPDGFKMSMLKRIRDLYPPTVKDPIAAGFGNTQTDIASYIYAGIAPEKCFIVSLYEQDSNISRLTKIRTRSPQLINLLRIMLLLIMK
jgi:phosphatidate phosphatase PAH1